MIRRVIKDFGATVSLVIWLGLALGVMFKGRDSL